MEVQLNQAGNAAANDDMTSKAMSQEDKQLTAEDLRGEENNLSAQLAAAMSQAQDLLFAPVGLQTAAAHMTQPLYRMLTAVSQIATMVYTIGATAQRLMGPDAVEVRPEAVGRSGPTTVYVVTVMHSLLGKVISPGNTSSMTAATEDSTTNSQGNSVFERAAQGLHSDVDILIETMTLPGVVAQLELAIQNLSNVDRKRPDDLDQDFAGQMLEDLSHLDIDQDSSHSAITASRSDGTHQQKLPEELTPFNDFDTSLPGAGDILEPFESSPLEAKPGTPASDLVAFTDFDTSLEGADQLLELNATSQTSDTSQALAQPPPDHTADTNNPATNSDVMQSSSDAASSSPEVQHLTQAMLQYLQCAGAVAVADLEEQSLTSAQAGLQLLLAQDSQNETVRHEWVYEPALQEALQTQGGLGQPAVIGPQVGILKEPS